MKNKVVQHELPINKVNIIVLERCESFIDFNSLNIGKLQLILYLILFI
jgi:hypothetical protein